MITVIKGMATVRGFSVDAETRRIAIERTVRCVGGELVRRRDELTVVATERLMAAVTRDIVSLAMTALGESADLRERLLSALDGDAKLGTALLHKALRDQIRQVP